VTGDPIGDWSSRRVLVTGAAGLLGRVLCRELLAARAAVIGLDLDWPSRASLAPEGVVVVPGDARDQTGLERLIGEARVDTVVHLAAQTLVGRALEDPVATFSHNIEGTWSVLEACRSHPRVERVVVASSDKAYGDAGGRPYREDFPLRPRHPYDASKASADLLAQTYALTYGLPVAVTRCANLYGGGDLNWSRIVPGTIRSVIQGERPVLRSDGTFLRDYLYVRDAAIGVLVLADALGRRPELLGQAFNFAAGQRLTALEMVSRILAVMRSDLEPRILAEPLREILVQRVSAARARRHLGWRPRSTLAAGLAETITWYRGFLGVGGP
jgi:CDP-glucose 4,6-dehydratase